MSRYSDWRTHEIETLLRLDLEEGRVDEELIWELDRRYSETPGATLEEINPRLPEIAYPETQRIKGHVSKRVCIRKLVIVKRLRLPLHIQILIARFKGCEVHARMASLAYGTVGRLENGFKEARPETIRKIAEVLRVEQKELVKREV